MSQTIDDITMDFEEEGVLVVKQLDKEILTKGAWTTIVFKYQDWNKKDQVYGPPKFSIRRYQKRNDQYWLKSKFNISSVDQARKVITTLEKWIGESESESES